MKDLLRSLITQAVKKLPDSQLFPLELLESIHVERTRDSNYGDFASNVAMVLAKNLKSNPRQLAQQIVAQLPTSDLVANVEIAGPGFINFFLTDAAFQNSITEILAQTENYGQSTLGHGQSVHMEVVSSNPTGPLHVGHGRLAAYSGSLANILAAAGFKVHREYYVNDAGRQMQILTVSIWLRYLELWDEKINFPLSGYKGDYVIDIARQLKGQFAKDLFYSAAHVYQDLPNDDEEHKEQYIDALINRAKSLIGANHYQKIFNLGLTTIVNDMREDLAEFGVVCDQWFYESHLLQQGEVARGIEKLRQGNFLYENQGALWFRSTDFGDEKDRVVIRDNGQPTYFASDIGYHLNKYERGFSQILDVYGSDHHGYIPRLRAFLTALGNDADKVKVLLIQFVALYRAKVKVAMSTRAGEFVTLRELRAEVGNDAARFFYIMRKRDQHLDFDLELAKSKSSDNPVYYIQYAHARICSVFHQLRLKNLQWEQDITKQDLALLTAIHEKKLLRDLSRFPEVIEMSALSYEPCVLAHYLLELANSFHTYYNAHQFLVDEEKLRNARLSLIIASRYVLAAGLKLLGVSAPEFM